MKRLILTRDDTSEQGTFSIGILWDSDDELGRWQWAELPWRDNAAGVSCVPAGTYSAVLVQSPHFGFPVYQLTNVPGRSAVEIHPGNVAGDTAKGYRSDVRGCACPGITRGTLVEGSVQQKGVLQSQKAFQWFMAACGEDNAIEVQMEWKAGLP